MAGKGRRSRRGPDRYRKWSQVAGLVVLNPFFAYFSTRSTYAGPLKGACAPGLNCYACPFTVFACPVGGLQHGFVLLREKAAGLFLKGLGVLLYVGAFLSAVGALVGRLPCGWVCPFGLFQELAYRIPGRKRRLPGWASALRYPVLAGLVFLLPLATGEAWFSRLCPAGFLEGALPLKAIPPAQPLPPTGWFFWLKAALFGALVLWCVPVYRPFCRAVCPLGTVWGWFNGSSLFRLEVEESACSSCGICSRACPVDLELPGGISSHACIRCLRCVGACPEGALRFGLRPPGERAETAR
ncbi:MAG: 4Fe-4S binding protein [Candidatus Geothermincolales bacterium]